MYKSSDEDNEISNEILNENSNLYCIFCKKLFKNKGTLETHIRSKTHFKKQSNSVNLSNKKEIYKDSKNHKDISEQKFDENIDNSDINYDIDNTSFKEALKNMIERNKNKKKKRNIRINNHSEAVNLALAEHNLKINDQYIDYTDKVDNRIRKINKAGNKIQKNILTSSRSSFVKSSLKP